MTPKERARLIDKQEFEAEAKAVRERAFAHVAQIQQAERAKISGVMGTLDGVKPKPKSRTRIVSTTYTHDGKSLTLSEWSRATGILHGTLRSRLTYGWTFERTITTPINEGVGRPRLKPKIEVRGPGVSPVFAPFEGTGAGSTTQETSEITFSEETENA